MKKAEVQMIEKKKNNKIFADNYCNNCCNKVNCKLHRTSISDNVRGKSKIYSNNNSK